MLILSKLSIFFLSLPCEYDVIGSHQMTFILTYPRVVFYPPVFPWWHFAGVEYHTIISVALAPCSANNLDSPACC